MKDFFVNIWIVVIIAVVVVGTGLGLGLGFGLRGGGPARASLPTWSEGNQWVYEQYIPGAYTGNLTLTVTGQEKIDGVDCYTLDFTLDVGSAAVGSGDLWFEKDTLLQKKREMWPTFQPGYHIVVEWSYDFDEALWPLEVGKEVAITYNENWTDYMDSVLVTTHNETINGTVNVEVEDTVTVPAGTFDCFKVVLRDDDGTVRAEMCYSEQVKSWVKMELYNAGGGLTEREELKSYPV